MDEEMAELAAALEEWRNRKAAADAFRAAVGGKGELDRESDRFSGRFAGPVGELSPGVIRAMRRELELSCAYLDHLEVEAEKARDAVNALARSFRNQGVRMAWTDLESGVA